MFRKSKGIIFQRMVETLLPATVIVCLSISGCNPKSTSIRYTVAGKPWKEEIMNNKRQKARSDVQPTAPNHFSLGNHRALIRVTSKGAVAYLDLEWRRHDKGFDKTRFIIINTKSQDTIKNIYRLEVNNEHCKILFGPVIAGEYYFYYLPFEIQGGWGGYGKDYLPCEPLADREWVSKNNIQEGQSSDFVVAKCIEIQARTEFDSFYPMEVIATEKEKKILIASNKKCKFLLFPEDRKYPIRMLDNIPQKWILNPLTSRFEGVAGKNEYYVFQIGLWALENLGEIKVEFNPLKGERFIIPITSMTCFNTGGIDPSGKAFSKTVNVSEGRVQPLWIGLDLPESIPSGIYKGVFKVHVRNGEPKEIGIIIKVNSDFFADRGDGEPWRHSRLRWLNSTIGIDDNPVFPYEPIKISGNKLTLTDKEINFNEYGMPSSINVLGEEVLVSPVQFTIETASGKMQFRTEETKVLKETKNTVSKEVTQRNGIINILTHSEVESDGWMRYYFDINAVQDIDISDIRLEIPYSKENSVYLSGMDLYGVETPDNHNAKWDPLYDAFWIGSTKAGLYCELRGATYCGPLLYYQPIRDFYKPAPPESWNNSGKGGFRICSNHGQHNAIIYSGGRRLKKGDSLNFECAFIITPVKRLDTHHQFTNRYFQNQYHPEPTDNDAALGVKVVNLHHANEFNPNINYPYIATREMKGYVDRCHAKGIKTKIYYTTRELTNFTTELWALRSLGNEILTGGDGGGYPWLREHLADNYTPQWYQYLDDSRDADAAVLTSVGMTRWYNYYIEGLHWLVKNIGIDGLYIDAAAYDREIVKRIRKAMAEVKEGCLLDLHEGHNCILRYMEFFPYLDKIWIGEGINYDKVNPVDWLVSISGIPYGLMSDMLQLGGNPWRGMVYGTTTRYGWTTDGVFCDPTNIWKVWDDFEIANSKMVGYWDDKPVITASDKKVLATAYLKDKEMLISLASWENEATSVKLNIDFRKTGIDPDRIKIIAPAVKDFQEGREFNPDEPIPVEPAKGWLLIVREQ
jgi:hypothetical protein